MKKEILYLSIIFNRNNVLIPCSIKSISTPTISQAPKPSKIVRQSRKHDVNHHKTNQPTSNTPSTQPQPRIPQTHPSSNTSNNHASSFPDVTDVPSVGITSRIYPEDMVYLAFYCSDTQKISAVDDLDNIYINNP